MFGHWSSSRRVIHGAVAFVLASGITAAAFVAAEAVPSAAATTIGPVDASLPDGAPNSLRDVLENQIGPADTVVLEADKTYTLGCQTQPTNVGAAVIGGQIQVADEVTIEGNGATIAQQHCDRVLYTTSAITLHDVTMTGGTAHGRGGGLFVDADVPAVLDGVTFVDNETQGTQLSSGDGGAVAAGGDLSITGSSLVANAAQSNGGAVYYAGHSLTVSGSTIDSNQAGSAGGGIFTINDGTSLSVSSTTISNNTASGTSLGQGGGALRMVTEGGSVATFVNSTIVGNHQALNGALWVEDDLALTNVTLDANANDVAGTDAVAAAAGPGAANLSTRNLTIAGTVVTRPLGGVNCALLDGGTSGGYNFSDDSSCGLTGTGDRQSAGDPLLGALADNGGPNQTELPATGSPLLDAIPPTACFVDADQRGITRPQGTGCDTGAVEVEVVAPTPLVIQPAFTG
jgi:hypothetical protein